LDIIHLRDGKGIGDYMSDTLAHNAGAFFGAPTTDVKSIEPAAGPNADNTGAPVGYRWVSRRWKVLPDGTRDYAAFHGKTAFNVLLPVSSRLRSSKF
jgi:hypothetical protein